jgi:hypothetical protein
MGSGHAKRLKLKTRGFERLTKMSQEQKAAATDQGTYGDK